MPARMRRGIRRAKTHGAQRGRVGLSMASWIDGLQGTTLSLELELREAVGNGRFNGGDFLGTEVGGFLEAVLGALEGGFDKIFVNLGFAHGHVGEDMNVVALNFGEAGANGE